MIIYRSPSSYWKPLYLEQNVPMCIERMWVPVFILQVTADAYDEGDTDPVHTLVEWYRPSVDNSVIVPHLSPETYYFICGVAGHCSAGMKLKVDYAQNSMQFVI